MRNYIEKTEKFSCVDDLVNFFETILEDNNLLYEVGKDGVEYETEVFDNWQTFKYSLTDKFDVQKPLMDKKTLKKYKKFSRGREKQ